MPGSTGVVQLAGVPRRPSISTRHKRHDPKLLTLSVAHNLGIDVPCSDAARMMLDPAGTVTVRPSMVSVIGSLDLDAGVPKSFCGWYVMDSPYTKMAGILRDSFI
jgi:hypothetical protein